jgi:hypothetical protein
MVDTLGKFVDKLIYRKYIPNDVGRVAQLV